MSQFKYLLSVRHRKRCYVPLPSIFVHWIYNALHYISTADRIHINDFLMLSVVINLLYRWYVLMISLVVDFGSSFNRCLSTASVIYKKTLLERI